jgi:glutathione synthase/RimK-type ligase-like ATP-grasp enzyme
VTNCKCSWKAFPKETKTNLWLSSRSPKNDALATKRGFSTAGMRKKRIGIVTVENDIHALTVQSSLARYSDTDCDIIEVNRLCGSSGLSWTNWDRLDQEPSVPAKDRVIDVSELDLIWWRRINTPQEVPADIALTSHIDLINNECRTALAGVVFTAFSGTWISDPAASVRSENKLVQLEAARRAGFKVPRTLISQDPEKIRQFCAALDNQVVVKPLKGTHQVPVLTTMLAEAHLESDTSLSLCPTIYQEYVAGTDHLRVCCFGDKVSATLLKSEELDWRKNLDIPAYSCMLPDEIESRLRKVLQILGLRMGIFDLKRTNGNEHIWLEVNPQGQFLFVEGLSGTDLTTLFADFLYGEAEQAFSQFRMSGSL